MLWIKASIPKLQRCDAQCGVAASACTQHVGPCLFQLVFIITTSSCKSTLIRTTEKKLAEMCRGDRR
ncbi:hypothetical protein EXN66_Car006005 [Channa argus]|uniref:Uncharacterized protein n=1 Tax=Channa argus TaxID=215402 RepID=A0A6G1PJG4_CHAAH|nr:hypothetical protein EXN66_Car006005 [Channa argus]